jgi:hypothetical protein
MLLVAYCEHVFLASYILSVQFNEVFHLPPHENINSYHSQDKYWQNVKRKIVGLSCIMYEKSLIMYESYRHTDNFGFQDTAYQVKLLFNLHSRFLTQQHVLK